MAALVELHVAGCVDLEVSCYHNDSKLHVSSYLVEQSIMVRGPTHSTLSSLQPCFHCFQSGRR